MWSMPWQKATRDQKPYPDHAVSAMPDHMASEKESLDRVLRDFLEEDRRAKAEGHTIANVRLEVHELAKGLRGVNARVAAIEVDHDDIHDTLDLYGAKITSVTSDVAKIKRRLRRDGDDEEMDTGRFDVEEIKRELAETRKRRADSERAKKDEIVWWKRSLITWTLGVLGFVATTAVTILITLAIMKGMK